jgi:hypothetical protein
MDSEKLTEQISEKSNSKSPILQGYGITGDGQIYYVIIERLVTKMNDIEHELKCSWRILDILNQECIKMWERLEKLEGFLCEQQNVITQLVELYTTQTEQNEYNIVSEPTNNEQNSVGELDTIVKSLGSAINLEETSVLRKKLAQQELTKTHNLSPDSKMSVALSMDVQRKIRYMEALETLEEEVAIPDEAFYRSLNNAYREDLICGDSSRPTSQLGMIWEEAEDVDEPNGKKDIEKSIFEKKIEIINDEIPDIKQKKSNYKNEGIQYSLLKKQKELCEDEGEIFSSTDYKSYRGNAPCVSELDLAQLSTLSSINETSLDKLRELNILSNKLQNQSQNFIEKSNKLLKVYKKPHSSEAETKLSEEASKIDKQLRIIHAETEVENWTYSKSPSSMGRSISRVSTDSGLMTDGDFTTRSISPRLNSASRNHLDSITSKHTPSKLGFVASILHDRPDPIIQLPIDVGNFAKGYAENKELTDLMAESLAPLICTSPSVYNKIIDKISSTQSVGKIYNEQSIRTLQDDHIDSEAKLNLEFSENRSSQSPTPSTPPPPAPNDVHKSGISLNDEIETTSIEYSPNSCTLENTEILFNQNDISSQLSHSEQALRILPKHMITTNNNIIKVKSDTSLSSINSWNNLEKSFSSPENCITKVKISYCIDQTRSPLVSNIHTSGAIATIPSFSKEVNLKINPESFYNTFEEKESYGNQEGTITYNSFDITSNCIPISTCTIDSLPNSSTTSFNEDLDALPTFSSELIYLESQKQENHKYETNKFDSSSMGMTLDFLCRNTESTIYSIAGNNQTEIITHDCTNNSEMIGKDIIIPVTKYEIPFNNENKCKTLQNTLSTTTKNPLIYMSKPIQTISCSKTVNEDDHKKVIYKTMFPTGNITDALTYYPTSKSISKTESNHTSWLNMIDENMQNDTSLNNQLCTPEISHSSNNINYQCEVPTSYQCVSIHTNSNHNFFETSQQNQQNQESYNYIQSLTSTENAQIKNIIQKQCQREQQHIYDQQSFKNLSSKNNSTEQEHCELYDPSNVIVTQSGYISISADIKNYEIDLTKSQKKIRRGSSLKNAMNSMSNWLPDLHLTKRYRSQSLPGDVRKEDLNPAFKSATEKQLLYEAKVCSKGLVARKKKKHILVSTVSGILQKAKRKTHLSQSFSDPEQSETEWNSEKQQDCISEDEDNTHSDVIQDINIFTKVPFNVKRIQSHPKLTQQKQTEELILSKAILQQPIIQKEQVLQKQIRDHQEQLHQKIAKDNWIETPVTQYKIQSIEQQSIGKTSCFEEDSSIRNTASNSSTCSIFATVGDIKRYVNSSDSSPTDQVPKLPVTLVGGASMEFAVSRALGKYRQKQSSIISDEQIDNLNDDKNLDENIMYSLDMNFICSDGTTEKSYGNDKESKVLEIATNISEEIPFSNNNNSSNIRGSIQNSNRPISRHQQSLEIPWTVPRSGDGDEDNRSTYSYRSTSRVSSRRQSTEDSIDSEDEWYCYELRKLEELERQSETIIETITDNNVIEETLKVESYQPDEDVKERMSQVLKELKLKSKRITNIDEDFSKEVPTPTSGTITFRINPCSDGKPVPKNKCAESVESIFTRVTDYHTWINEEDVKLKKNIIILDEESSGDTSGPDSQIHSDVEDDEFLIEIQQRENSRKGSNRSTLQHCEKLQHESIIVFDEDNEIIPPNDLSINNLEIFKSANLIEDENKRAEIIKNDTTTVLCLPKIKMDTSPNSSSDTVLKDSQVSLNLSNSKWKLLKALKERKAEEKLKEVEEATKDAAFAYQGIVVVSILIKYKI